MEKYERKEKEEEKKILISCNMSNFLSLLVLEVLIREVWFELQRIDTVCL